MLSELKFVLGAVAKKDLVPAMKHFAIRENTIRAYNGSLALCAPLQFDIDCNPTALELTKAIANCDAAHPVTISMTAKGKLKIQNGPYNVAVECIDQEIPHPMPSGERMDFDGQAIVKAFKTLLPFVGNDASRVWTNGILLRNQSAYATKNVILVEYWLQATMPISVNVPVNAVREVLRVGEPPTHAQVDASSITFHFDNGKWIRTGLYSEQWPDLTPVFDTPSQQMPIDPQIFSALEAIDPFLDKQKRVFFKNSFIRTHTEEEIGAKFEMQDFPFDGCYRFETIELLKGVTTTIDWSSYPERCQFFGENLRGTIIGQRY